MNVQVECNASLMLFGGLGLLMMQLYLTILIVKVYSYLGVHMNLCLC